MTRDRTLFCVQCESPFVFSAAEQDRYNAFGFDEPKRCPNCRKKRFKMPEGNTTRDFTRHKKKHHSKKRRFDNGDEE